MIAAAGAVIIGAGVWWWRAPVPVPSPASRPAPAAPRPRPDVPFLNIEETALSGVDAGGRRLWDVRATTLQVDRARNVVTLTDVAGQFYQAGTPSLVFTAPRGVYSVQTKQVELSGGVVGTTPDGRTLRAPTVRWDGRQQQFTASGGVTVSQQGMTIRADRLSSDAALRHPTFTGNITVKVTE